ncbi:MAG: DEAD/DEAH box helicase [Candidatus Obscuribacterales bacterium]|nr:DEAD/DEAH box helicase [Candidatus Obscuribacterales bacterium]
MQEPTPLDLESLFGFKLDDFQIEAINHLEAGSSVIVCAPTGSGKTVVAEYAVEMALRTNKRCFYTTPLKALSNQKLYDLKQKYGEDKVGLLTGDISVNREAPIVVMTTEVFRNMLYGTILGDVSKNLRDVAFVILDECHYMNDAERGTVWEESIIYAPKDIQLVGLSATVANAQELTTWIDETHGPTHLVQSNFRPVPLRFYYFGDRHIYPLLDPGKGVVNSMLKSRFGQKRPLHKGMKRRNIPSLGANPADVLGVLSGRNMLPAIYFLFSRRGCEESMKKARGIPLLNVQEQSELKEIVTNYIQDHPNLANHPHLPYLFEGLSVHHAGMLPSWKAMVEKLFQRGLLKVVFATETLAAGINMPARTTVISSISKRSDDGHRHLHASEFLQMSGRAGRRGMDEVGHVVVLHHPFEPVDDAAKLAVAPPDPLSSRFTPSYGMVLNLLERHTLDDARDLVERSFGQFLVNTQLEPLYEQNMVWQNELDRLQSPLCPTLPGDLPLYVKRLEAIRFKHKQLRQMERGLKHNEPEAQSALQVVHAEINDTLNVAYAMPCHGCPEQKPCSKQSERVKQLEKRIKEFDRRIEKETTKYWRTFVALTDILRLKGYLDADKPTALGRTATGIRGTNELFLTEVAISSIPQRLKPAEFAALMTALVTEEGRLNENVRARVSGQVEVALEHVSKLARNLWKLQRDFEIDISVEFSPTFAGLTEMWANGASWDDIRMATSYDEGDVVRALRRTLDLIRQFMRAPGMKEEVVNLCREAETLLARDEIKEDF